MLIIGKAGQLRVHPRGFTWLFMGCGALGVPGPRCPWGGTLSGPRNWHRARPGMWRVPGTFAGQVE